MKNKSKIINIKRLGFVVVTVLMIGFILQPALSQKFQPSLKMGMTYDELEKIQGKIEDLNVEIYKIMDKYQDVSYEYTNEDGEAPEVVITGMPYNNDRKQLTGYLIELKNHKKKILNLSNRVGVYYVTETDPEPKVGYRDFYTNLYDHLRYPEVARNNGVEGNVLVKFIVTEEGEVKNVVAHENIQTTYTDAVEELRMVAKNAIKETSGEWIPAKAGGVPVSHWVAIPIEFKLESPFHLMPLN